MSAARRPRWLVDKGWTGNWELPDILTRPLCPAERDALVALSCGGMGNAAIARALVDTTTVREVLDRTPGTANRRLVLEILRRCGAGVVLPPDDAYPRPLRAIAAPPPLLYVRGERLDRLEPLVAVVGSRSCSRGAARFARRIGETVAAAGFTVASGLARGIDAAAHEGALDAGRTVAVLGTGLDRIYPAEHRDLADRIVDAGALVTEFPPGVGPREWHFPSRNRLISGLSMAVVVVEAGLRSGALITAAYALEQGREVFACITGPENPAGAGIREMLREGARLVVHPDDLAAELAELAGIQGCPPRRDDGPRIPPHLAIVYGAVGEETPTDEVAARAGLPSGRAAALLSELELDGLVEEVAGRWSRLERS